MIGVKSLNDKSKKFEKYLDFMKKKANIRKKTRNSIDFQTKSKFFELFESKNNKSISPQSDENIIRINIKDTGYRTLVENSKPL